jgi:hypothetical protein
MKPGLVAALIAAMASLVAAAVRSISAYRNQIGFRPRRGRRTAIAANCIPALRPVAGPLPDRKSAPPGAKNATQ